MANSKIVVITVINKTAKLMALSSLLNVKTINEIQIRVNSEPKIIELVNVFFVLKIATKLIVK